MEKIRIALAGNPNAGKTTIFNALTGESQHVGNWPGKTVKRITGTFIHKNHEVKVIDLPGTYSLSSYSPEEKIARDHIAHGNSDMVVDVVDASNLEHNLYLTVQIMETNVPLILLLNMGDIAERRGIKIDFNKLSKKLGGIPVIPTIASKEVGLEELKDTILKYHHDNNS